MEKSTAKRIKIAAVVLLCAAGLAIKTIHYERGVTFAQDKTSGINFDPTRPREANDPRIVPAAMQINVVKRNGRSYIEWNISEPIAMVGPRATQRQYPYVVKAVISPNERESMRRD